VDPKGKNMNRCAISLCLAIFGLCIQAQEQEKTDASKIIHQFLDAWHRAAATANREVFFGSMDEDSIYIGTDAGERWRKTEFSSWAGHAFDRSCAWDFKPIERQIYISEDGNYAWFNETLATWMGVCRGSGVLKRYENHWKIKHYHLSVTVPNEIIKEFIALVGRTSKPKSQYQPVEKFDPNRDACKDIEDVIKEAAGTGKRIILDVGGDWCVWCRRLSAFLKEHPTIQDCLQQNFIMLKINFSKENKNEKVLESYPKIKGYPHIFVLDTDGKLLYSKDTGELEEGSSYSEQKILQFLQTWAANPK
jgi:thiol-disulfide isomerase/thioredoxin